MDREASTPARVTEMPTPEDAQAAPPKRSVVLVAWTALFLTPVGIYWRLVTHDATAPVWVDLVAFGLLVLLVITAIRIDSLRPIRTFLLTVLALGAAILAVSHIERSHVWTEWAAGASEPKVVFADSALEVIPCALMTIVLVIAAVSILLILVVQINRNEVLSRIAGTKPGAVTWDWHFILNIVLIAVVPSLSFVGSELPWLRDGLFSWIDPVLKALGRN